VSDEPVEAVLVCLRVGYPSGYDDNRYGPCSECGHQVMWRPHAPSNLRRVCLQCMLPKWEPDDKIVVTREAALDVLRHLGLCEHGNTLPDPDCGCGV
jgi:hypothetical protein